MPHGCFEQTSSTHYPNVLIYDALKRSGHLTPELEARARGLSPPATSGCSPSRCRAAASSGSGGRPPTRCSPPTACSS